MSTEPHNTSTQVDDSAHKQEKVAVPRLGAREMLRWAWTQLTSMRTALFLLLLLAVAAVPGSLFPQRVQSTAAVTQYIKDRPGLGEVMDWFKLFDVYSSPWFSAIYLLLFISLIGCVIPRAAKHWSAMRAGPPRTPKRLERLPEYGELTLPETLHDADAAVATAAQVLRKRGYRVKIQEAASGQDKNSPHKNPEGQESRAKAPSVAAERGFVKEFGNLLFHVSLIGVLIFVAVSGLFGYAGQKVLVAGDSFVNTLSSYDTFTPGTNFRSEWLNPFAMNLQKFTVQFDRSQRTGQVQPIDYTADVAIRDNPDAEPRNDVLKVNQPVSAGGTSVYLLGNGYAPHFTVRDGSGQVAFSGWVIGRISSSDYTSSIVVKVPDAKPDQLGFAGLFLPSAAKDAKGVDINVDPDPVNPTVLLNSYYGDLGLDSGRPQNAFVLDTEKLTPLNDRKLATGGITLAQGESYQLPESKGSIEFDGLARYIGIEVRSNPGQEWILVFCVLALLGLSASLFLSRRRVWVRVAPGESGQLQAEYALLARGDDPRLGSEARAIRQSLAQAWDLTDHDQADHDTTDGSDVTDNKEDGQ